MKALAVALIALLAVSPPAQAGDTANLEILGFSGDGSIFAFEEHGVQDGSGFPYSNRFYIETATDRFVPGSPIRALLEDDQATPDQARGQTRYQGERLVPAATLADNPGFTAGFNAITEHSADSLRMAVNPRPVFPPVDAAVEFRLAEIPVTPPEGCADLGPIVGFRLTRIDATPGGETILIHDDAHSVPTSRRCPTGYRLGAVQTFHPEGGTPVFAVLIAIRSFGFEGPDWRWMAITGRL